MLIPKVYSEPTEASRMKLFAKQLKAESSILFLPKAVS